MLDWWIMPSECPEYCRLQRDVTRVLETLSELTSAQLTAFQLGNSDLFARLDRQLEAMVGLKERTIGAMRQHAVEHNCQPS